MDFWIFRYRVHVQYCSNISSLRLRDMAADSVAALAAELVQLPTLADPLPQPLSLSHRQQGVSHEGGLSALRCFVSKLRAGRVKQN